MSADLFSRSAVFEAAARPQQPLVPLPAAPNVDDINARKQLLLKQIVATPVSLNLALETIHVLLTGGWVDAVFEYRSKYGTIPSIRTLRRYEDGIGSDAISLVMQHLHGAGVPPIHAVLTDNSSDARGHTIVNTIGCHAWLRQRDHTGHASRVARGPAPHARSGPVPLCARY